MIISTKEATAHAQESALRRDVRKRDLALFNLAIDSIDLPI